MIRFIYVLRRLPGMSLEEFQQYWREKHGPLVAGHSSHMGVSRYVQVHTLDDPANQAMRESRGLVEPFDGVAELWWDDAEKAATASATPEGQEAAAELLEDEKKFIDFSRSSIWFATDVPQINPTPENIVASERSTIVKLFYVFNRLLSLNEVGGDPNKFGWTRAQFHEHLSKRLADWPNAMLGTSTHDTKRSEDVRMRMRGKSGEEGIREGLAIARELIASAGRAGGFYLIPPFGRVELALDLIDFIRHG